jgi:hypothetical protein
LGGTLTVLGSGGVEAQPAANRPRATTAAAFFAKPMDQTESLEGSVKSVGDAPLALNTTAPVGFFIIHGDNLMEPPRRIFAKLACMDCVG